MRQRDAELLDCEEGERPRTPAPVPPSVAGLLAMQQGVGNAAVARAILARDEPGPAAGAAGGAGAALANLNRNAKGPDVELLQLKLNRHLGFMRRTLLLVDSDFGGKTAGAVVAFKRQRGIRPPDSSVTADVWAALDTAPQAVGETAAHQGVGPEYDRMLADGLLEVTLAVGYDEHGELIGEANQIARGLSQVRGFTIDPGKAAQLRTAAGRPPTQQTGEMYVKENYSTSNGQPVHAVITLIRPAAGTASGATQRASAMAGMNESDAFLYAGHARYGTGPDFDAQYVITVHWDKHPRGQPVNRPATEEFLELEALEEALGIGDGPSGVTAFKQLEKDGVVEFRSMSAGNVGMNAAATSHRTTLGAYLISRSEEGAPTAQGAAAISERKYRLWMFNGCSTKDYIGTIRQPEQHGGAANAGAGTRDLDLITTQKSTYLMFYSETILSTLDGMMAGESARALDQRQELATPEERSTHAGQGFEDNPTR